MLQATIRSTGAALELIQTRIQRYNGWRTVQNSPIQPDPWHQVLNRTTIARGGELRILQFFSDLKTSVLCNTLLKGDILEGRGAINSG